MRPYGTGALTYWWGFYQYVVPTGLGCTDSHDPSAFGVGLGILGNHRVFGAGLAQKSGMLAGVIIAGEVCFALAAMLLGKDLWARLNIKQYVRRCYLTGRKRGTDQAPDSEPPDPATPAP